MYPLGGEMENKKWNSKLTSLLHSLDIDSGSDIDEYTKNGKSPEDIKSKITSIYEKYIIDGLKSSKENHESINDDYDGIDDESDISSTLENFFNELKDDSKKSTSDALLDAVLIWFQELLIINAGQFKIIKNSSGNINIVFETDNIVDNKKIVSITDELTELINKIDNKTIIYNKLENTKPQPRKPKSTTPKKQAVQKNGTTKRTQGQSKKTTKNKNTK